MYKGWLKSSTKWEFSSLQIEFIIIQWMVLPILVQMAHIVYHQNIYYRNPEYSREKRTLPCAAFPGR